MISTPKIKPESKRKLKERSPLEHTKTVQVKKQFVQVTPEKTTKMADKGGKAGKVGKSDPLPDWVGPMQEQLKKLDILESIDIEMKGFRSTQVTMTTALTALTTQIGKLETKNTELEARLYKSETRCNDLERQCRYSEGELSKVQSELTWQEGIIKRTNLIISGIDEGGDRHPGGCRAALDNFLISKLGLDPDDISIIGCYRLGPIPNRHTTDKPAQPRKLMVKLNTVADRNKIWENKKKLKNLKFYINEDLPKETEKRRSTMYPILKKAKSIGAYQKGSYMIRDKLIVNQKKYTVETIDDLPHDLNPRNTATQTIGPHTFFFTSYSPFSNHFTNAPFTMGHNTYICTEQRFFSRKAQLLGDEDNYHKIMAAKDPKKMLDLGKKIVNYTGENWEGVDYTEMLNANRQKYLQNPPVMTALMATRGTELAECCGNSSKWGIGMSLDDPEKVKRPIWGENLLGQALMTLRDEFEEKFDKPHEEEDEEDKKSVQSMEEEQEPEETDAPKE
jgi:hypothetical protein